MKHLLSRIALFVCALTVLRPMWSQQPAKPAPDNLILKDGERLIGHVERADDTSIVFKSDLVGEVTVKWSDVTELHTAEQLAVIPKGASRKRNELLATAPQGMVSANAENITIAPASGQPQTVPVANSAHVIDAAAFQRDLSRTPGIFEDWTGTATAGVSLVEATQKSRNYTTAIALVRGIPPETWLEKRSRTEVDFSSSYGTVTEPGVSTLKTNIFHAAAQQDEYFSPSVYAFGQALFDHNFSLGLSLQQTYAGGIGWTVISDSVSQLDLKAGLSYQKQQFSTGPAPDLVGSVFSESYNHKFHRGWTLTQQLNILPAWNRPQALLANGNVNFTMPVYKRLNFTTGLIDSYLYDPPPPSPGLPPFKKNSVQFIMGVTYSLK